jgi:glutamate/tyrosine decarboxylase-like PLP-dependent enzyme
MATAWAVLHNIGRDGYLRLTESAIGAARRLVAGIREIEGLATVGEPEAHLVAMCAAPGFEDRVDIFAVGDALLRRGWHHDRQGPPDSLHSTVSAGNAAVIDDYLADLRACVDEVVGSRTEDRSTTYATLE